MHEFEKKTWYKTSVLLGRTLESLFESKDQRVLKTKLSSERESVLGKTQNTPAKLRGRYSKKSVAKKSYEIKFKTYQMFIAPYITKLKDFTLI